MRKIVSEEPQVKDLCPDFLASVEAHLPRHLSCNTERGCGKLFILDRIEDIHNGPVRGAWVYCPHCGQHTLVSGDLGVDYFETNRRASCFPMHGYTWHPLREWWRRLTGFYN